MRFNSYAAASAVAAIATAQTFTDCNPMEKECPNDPAIAATFETNFKGGKDAVKGWKQTAGTLNYVAEGAEFTVAKKGDAPTIQTEGYLHFGFVEVKMKAAPGAGIVSSIVVQSDNLDETDWEWIGGVDNKVQMNYFGKGNTTTYDRMIEAPINTVQNEFHTYALNWTSEALTWIIDQKPVRTLKYAEANGGNNFPQTPSNVRIGIWAGGDSENQGTRDWAGGPPDYSKAPFKMTVESIKIINYSPGTEYKWKDRTGSFQSIEVIGAGNKEGAPVNGNVIQPSGTGEEAPLASEVNTPGQKPGDKPQGEKPAGDKPANTTCTEGQQGQPTPPPSGQNPPAQPPAGPQNPENPQNPPCNCQPATVTVTGYPPEGPTGGPAPPAPPAPPAEPPVVSEPAPPAQPNPPYPTGPTEGIITDTNPPPTGTAPPVIVPTGNGTAPPPEFTGAASYNKAGAFVGAVAGAVLLAF